MKDESRTPSEPASAEGNGADRGSEVPLEAADAVTLPARSAGRRPPRRRTRRPRRAAPENVAAPTESVAATPESLGTAAAAVTPAEREVLAAGEPIPLAARAPAPTLPPPDPAELVGEWATAAEAALLDFFVEADPEEAWLVEFEGDRAIGVAVERAPEFESDLPAPHEEDWATGEEEAPTPEGPPLREPVFIYADTGEIPPLPPPSEAPERGRRRRRRQRDGRAATTAAAPAAEASPTVEVAPTEAAPAEAPPVEAAPPAQEPSAPAPAAPRVSRTRERTHREILVNVDDRETRIAVIEEGRLIELHVEREERVVGSIYKGRVANVLPGMDAAFVDIGLERNAFLYVGDILASPAEEEGEPAPSRGRRPRRDVHIKDVARPGQEILVQVVKGPRGTKGARVSTRMSVPGRYLVLMPDADHLGVSRKVEDPRERERLRKLAEAIRPPGFGLIVRTEAEGHAEAEIRQDLTMLLDLWREIQEKAKQTPAPALIHRDLSLILKTIRDIFSADVDRMLIDSETDCEEAVAMLRMLSPELVDRVSYYSDPVPIFAKYHVEEEVDRLLRRKVWLKSGGYLTIDSTEALTTIDVNTGKFVGTTSLSDTILKTNLEAVTEIARQLRLRDIGGIIVIDFIDMASPRDRAQVMRALEQALRRDRTRTKIAHISPLGLVEMTRKRTAETILDVMTETCPYCQGRGRVWSAETMAIHIAREIKRKVAEQRWDAVLVNANAEVATWLIGPEGEHAERLERAIRRPVYIRARHDFHIEKYELLPGDMLELEEQIMPFRGGQVVEAEVRASELVVPPRAAAWVDGYFVDLANGARFHGQTTRIRLTDVRRSYALGEPVPPSTAIDKSEPI